MTIARQSVTLESLKRTKEVTKMTYNFDHKIVVGKYQVQIDSNAQYGFFENVVDGGEGGLWFTDNELVDYDGYYELPESVIVAIGQLGFNPDYAK